MPLNCYIDESGDGGFVFSRPGSGEVKSSRWFILGAVVVSTEQELQVAKAVNRIKRRLYRQKREKPLHWKDLKHVQKKVVIQELRGKSFTILVVGVAKPDPAVRGKIMAASTTGRGNRVYFCTAEALFDMLCAFAKAANATINLVTFERWRGLLVEDLRNCLRPLLTRH